MSKRSIDTGTADVVRDVEDVLDNIPYRSEFRQFKRQNNVKVAQLYALYLQGNSLQYIADVLYQGRFSRQSLHDVFRVRGYKLRSKKLRPVRTYKGKAYRRDPYGLYRNRSGGVTTYLHRLMWEEKNGRIPAGHVIVFRDGDKENLTPGNLQCLHREEAKRLYNYGNQHGYKRAPDKGSFCV